MDKYLDTEVRMIFEKSGCTKKIKIVDKFYAFCIILDK